MAWSGQTVAAVAGRRLERGVRRHLARRPVDVAQNCMSENSQRLCGVQG